jgi:hypothetical protein
MSLTILKAMLVPTPLTETPRSGFPLRIEKRKR